MKVLGTAVPLLVVIMMGVQPGAATRSTAIQDEMTSISQFINQHSGDFLDHVRNHFNKSLTYLLTGNGFADKSVQRPGLAKLFKGESDRHWDLGIEALQKYFQRGGSSNDQTFNQTFTFEGENRLSSDSKVSISIDTYLQQCGRLVTDCKDSTVYMSELQKKTMRRNENHFDSDISHYLEEKVEKEIEVLRKFSNLHTNLHSMKELGVAQYIFDKGLSD